LLRQPEIQNLRVSPIRHENIRGLDIPVHDSFRVRRIQRVRNFNPPLHQLLDRHRPLCDAFPQCLPLQAFHRNERASAVLSYVVYRANVWVIQSGGRFCFSLEPFQRLRVVRQVFR
jgi:hypothetical protein